jgi:outer membrane protein OmpA-like peptidoglycan-associated protein
MFGSERNAPAPSKPAPGTKACADGGTVPINENCQNMNIRVSVTAAPRELCAGEKANVAATVSGAPQNQVQYVWTVDGTTASTSSSFEFDSNKRAPGKYDVVLTVKGDNINPSTATATIIVREYQPPTGMVQADSARITVGEKSILTSRFQGRCGGPIQAAQYEVSEGSLQGNRFDSSSVRFDSLMNAEQRKTVTVTATAADNLGKGTGTTTIEVVRPAAPAAVRLPDVLFSQNSARVNDCGKRILLEQLRAYFEADSSAAVALVGHTSTDETSAGLPERRALNAAAVITDGTGVCMAIPRSQVRVSAPGAEQYGQPFESAFCRSSVDASASNEAEMRRVEVWFVPNGSLLPSSVTNDLRASELPISSLGCPK